MDCLIKNAAWVISDADSAPLSCCNIWIDGGKITYIGKDLPETKPDKVIDARNMAAMPGLINCHTHLSMTLLRNYADDYPLQVWLNEHIFPAEGRLDAACVEAGTLWGIAECLRFGVTSVTDMYMFLPSIGKAALESGIKANLCNGYLSFDRDGFDFRKDNVTLQNEEFLQKYHMADSGRIKLDAGIHAEYTTFDKIWRSTADYAAEHGLGIHVHLSETESEHNECIGRYGMTPASVLAAHGVFDVPVNAAHCCWLSDDDMRLMAVKGATAVHNPVSNLKLGSGVARITRMKQLGVNVAVGTDGPSSNNNHDMFEEMKLAAILQKGISGNAAAMSAAEAFRMCTENGAKAQGRYGECGRLLPGMDADIVLVDLDSPHLFPVNNIMSGICYSACGSDVAMTMVRGKVLYEKGCFNTIDIEKLKYTINNYALPRVFGK